MSGSASLVCFFRSSQGRCLKNFSGANFCFWVSWLVLCFSIAFCLGFCFILWFFAPENVSEKFSSCQICCFGGFVLLRFGFPSSSPFCFFQERKLRAQDTPHTALCVLVRFSFFVPAAPGLSPVLAVRPFFSRFVGVPFWAPGGLAFFGFSRYCRGLEITRPLLRPFLGREAARVLVVDSSFVVCCFFPFCVVCGHTFYGPEQALDAEVGIRADGHARPSGK